MPPDGSDGGSRASPVSVQGGGVPGARENGVRRKLPFAEKQVPGGGQPPGATGARPGGARPGRP